MFPVKKKNPSLKEMKLLEKKKPLFLRGYKVNNNVACGLFILFIFKFNILQAKQNATEITYAMVRELSWVPNFIM